MRYLSRAASAAAAITAEHVPLAVFRFVDYDHPTLSHPSGLVGALHATPVDWHVSEVDGDAVQLLPHRAPFLNGQALSAFVTATEETTVLRGVPATDGDGEAVAADALVFSPLQHACIVFSALVQVRLHRRCIAVVLPC